MHYLEFRHHVVVEFEELLGGWREGLVLGFQKGDDGDALLDVLVEFGLLVDGEELLVGFGGEFGGEGFDDGVLEI